MHTMQRIKLDLPDADIELITHAVDPATAHQWLQTLQTTLNWQQHHIQMFGKRIACPRLSAWYGEPGADYRYSGLQLNPQPWTTLLKEVREHVQAVSDTPCNSVLANWYRNGADSMGWHADNEPELGKNPRILSLSLGETRRFQLRNKHRKINHSIDLPAGSLLVMKSATQQHWQHAIPKQPTARNSRINLTFRTVFGT